jgi:ribonuclease BN (tRNA processing enzyme)
MRLTVLGSGTCELAAARSSPAYLVEAAGATVVLDLGQGAWRRLLETGRAVHEVDAVLLSHHHLDHMADLLPLLFALNYDPVLAPVARMTLVADHGIDGVLDGLARVFGRWVVPSSGALARASVGPGDTVELAGMTVRCGRAAHIDTSLAFRLESGGRSLAYLGDSTATEELAGFAAGVDLLVCHCVGQDDVPHPRHMSPGAAGRLASAAGAGAVLLSHLYSAQDVEASCAAAAEAFAGPVRAARDHMVLELTAGGLREVGGPV